MFSNSSSFGNVRSQSVREICLEIVTGHSVPLLNLQSHNKSFSLLRLLFGGVWPAQPKPPLQTPTEPLPCIPAGCWFSRMGGGVCVCLRCPFDSCQSPAVAQNWFRSRVSLMGTMRFGFWTHVPHLPVTLTNPQLETDTHKSSPRTALGRPS